MTVKHGQWCFGGRHPSFKQEAGVKLELQVLVEVGSKHEAKVEEEDDVSLP